MTKKNKDKDKEFLKTGCCQSGTDHGYSIEVRYCCAAESCEFNGEIITDKWKRLSTSHSEILVGVPTHNQLKFYLPPLHLTSYQAAKALQYWFHAALEARVGIRAYGQSLCFESRIIRHECKYSIEETKIEEMDVLTSKDFLDK